MSYSRFSAVWLSALSHALAWTAVPAGSNPRSAFFAMPPRRRPLGVAFRVRRRAVVAALRPNRRAAVLAARGVLQIFAQSARGITWPFFKIFG